MITRPCEKHPEAGVMPMPCPLCRVAELEVGFREQVEMFSTTGEQGAPSSYWLIANRLLP